VEVALRIAVLVLPLALSACARPPPAPVPAPMPEPAAAAPARLGTVVAVRPLAARGAEIVVRADTGETLVVVQPDPNGIGVGDRVALHHHRRARVSRTP
jgi:outer membrane lipoprotein SlyB